MDEKKYVPVTDGEGLARVLAEARRAQEAYAGFSQEKVDAVFFAAAKAANRARIPLAKYAVEETGMGVVEDKVIKNHYASEYVYNAYRNVKTCGVIARDESGGLTTVAEPVGVVAAVIPTTNPTSTAIFKMLLALKTRNAIIISPHPRAKQCTAEAARIVREAAINAGAPEGIAAWIDEPSLELTGTLMKEADVILATGGPGMVKAAYSSGKPAIGVGAGNTPVIIDDSASVPLAVNSIIHSKTFDNGTICASEQSVIALASVYDDVKKEFVKRGCYVLKKDETDKLRAVILKNGTINAAIVGQSAEKIAAMAGIPVKEGVKILLGEVESTDKSEPFAREKLSPVLALYKVKTFEEALDKADVLVKEGGYGHTSVLYADQDGAAADKIRAFGDRMKTGRVLLNMPSSHGAIGDLYNFRMTPSLTLGCGSWGGNSVSENVGVKQLLNIKIIAERRENMLWFRMPDKVYLKRGSLPAALDELKVTLNKKKAFVVTDTFLYKSGAAKPVTDKLDALGIAYSTFYNVEPDPTLACAKEGAAALRAFEPDVIIALGGGSAMDCAKIMWVLYEHPEVDFADMAMRFCDIRKRVYTFPKMGEKAYFIAVPTSAGTGSEVTPFAVITDEKTGQKYPLADYELMPDMAIIDADLMASAPKGLTAASGIDALTHALEAYASVMATDYTDGLALQAVKLIFRHLPAAYRHGKDAMDSREGMANAATIAGMAFANAFLGVCHSMAHKLGAFHHLPHGIANALMINEVILFNCSDAPPKMGTFPQYGYPRAKARYAQLAQDAGFGGKTDDEKVAALIAAIDKLKSDIGIKPCIQDYGIAESDFLARLDAMAEAAFDDQCTGANPRYPLIEEIKRMYLNAYYGPEGALLGGGVM